MKLFGRFALRLIIGLVFGLGLLVIKGQFEHLSRTLHHPPLKDLPQLDISNYKGAIKQQGWTN